MREARGEFDVVHDDGDGEPEFAGGCRANPEHPGEEDVVQLPDSDEEDRNYSQVSSNSVTSPVCALCAFLAACDCGCVHVCLRAQIQCL